MNPCFVPNGASLEDCHSNLFCLVSPSLGASSLLAASHRGQKAILANQATSFGTSLADWREGIGPTVCNS